ncbi:RDD family protein [Lysinibacillus telephonicus]|uniref:RDD family protein n=1 Tax=Lysinibacillus telephonicus TaxID=1714840 RepID=A0A3S0I499_9BACI|nr:RDD family protein [Lysinibacillus telephonicus]RTQ96113.1 RDD family protein [Lysinibacillus telephonicus]
MKSITKKRTKAFIIDQVISTVVASGIEYVLRKKIKNEAFHTLVTPTVVMWGLEYAQLRKNGQTVGYKALGLALENEDGTPLSSCQIAKRMLYRDFISTFDYIKNRESFEINEGTILPHDRVARTIVKEV